MAEKKLGFNLLALKERLANLKNVSDE